MEIAEKTLIDIAKELPALSVKYYGKSQFNYPERFGDQVPLKVKMLMTVKPDMPFFTRDSPNIVCKQGEEFYVRVNSYGAVSAIFENGKMLGLKPAEFEVTEWH